MKRFLSCVLCLCLLISCAITNAENADITTWYCTTCGNNATGNFCNNCGQKYTPEYAEILDIATRMGGQASEYADGLQNTWKSMEHYAGYSDILNEIPAQNSLLRAVMLYIDYATLQDSVDKNTLSGRYSLIDAILAIYSVSNGTSELAELLSICTVSDIVQLINYKNGLVAVLMDYGYSSSTDVLVIFRIDVDGYAYVTAAPVLLKDIREQVYTAAEDGTIEEFYDQSSGVISLRMIYKSSELDKTWQCSSCGGKENKGNYCSTCGAARYTVTTIPEVTAESTPYATFTQTLTATATGTLKPTPTPTIYNQYSDIREVIDDSWGSVVTSTPIPTRDTINENSSSSEIRELQWQLIELGWLNAEYPTGIYDKATVVAVKEFQTYMNTAYNASLTVDGICSIRTYTYLDNYTIAVKPAATSTFNTVTPTPSVIHGNSTAVEIHGLQLKLTALGWFTGDCDGNYNWDTYEAVTEFQSYVNSSTGMQLLAVSGYADKNTQLMLSYERFAKPAPTETPSRSPTPDPDDETNLLDDVFDTVTATIIADYTSVYERASHNSTVLGVLYKGTTFNILARNEHWLKFSNSAGAIGYVDVSATEQTTTATAEPTATPTPKPTYDANWIINSKLVAAFQDKLAQCGWLNLKDCTYGLLDDATYAAVYDVQLFFMTRYREAISPVCDGASSFRDVTGKYYPIDQVTYEYIMGDLPIKSF